MCIGGKSPSPPKSSPTPLPPVMVAPIEADTAAASAADDEKRRRRAASGRSDTVLTGGMGAAGQAQTGGKKLLGE